MFENVKWLDAPVFLPIEEIKIEYWRELPRRPFMEEVEFDFVWDDGMPVRLKHMLRQLDPPAPACVDRPSP
jgi:hypothetical protein